MLKKYEDPVKKVKIISNEIAKIVRRKETFKDLEMPTR